MHVPWHAATRHDRCEDGQHTRYDLAYEQAPRRAASGSPIPRAA